MQEAQELKQELFRRLAAEGAAQMGVADLRGLVPSGLETGVAVLVSLPGDLAQAPQTAPHPGLLCGLPHPQCPAGPDRDPGAAFLEQAGYRAGLRPLRPWSRMMAGPPPPPQDGGHPGGAGLGGQELPAGHPGVWQCGAPVQPGVTDAPLPWDPPVEESQCKGCSSASSAALARPSPGPLGTPACPGGPAAEGDLPGDPAAPDEGRHRHRHRPVRPVLLPSAPTPNGTCGGGRKPID